MRSKNIRLWIIIFIVLLNSIGFSIVLPLLPFLVGEFLPDKQIVLIMSLLMSVFAACTFLAAPVLGALSDKYGRKKILILSLLGSVVGYVLFGIGGALWVLFVGRIIDGLTAGNISILFAYISDSTKPEERTKWFGYVGAAMGMGKIGGPALGGLLGGISLAIPFYITAGLIFISVLAVYLLLPESLAFENRTKKLSVGSFNVFYHLRDVFKIKNIRMLLIVGLLFYISIGIFQFNFTVFLKDIYEWTPVLIGTLLTFVGISEIVSRAILLPWLLKHFSEKNIGTIGLCILAIGLFSVFVTVNVHSIVIVTIAVVCIIVGEGLFDPTYTGRLSRSVDESQQGKLQGVNQSIQSANNMLVPLGAAAIYFYSPSILYAMAVCVVFIAVLLFIKYIN